MMMNCTGMVNLTLNIPCPSLTLANSTEMGNRTNASGQSSNDNVVYLYFSVNVIGVVLNILVITIAILRPFVQSKVTRILLLNQCVTDAIGAFFWAITWMTGKSIVVPQNVAGNLLCHLWWTSYVQYVCNLASIINMVLFTIERYLSIVRPLVHQRLSIRSAYGMVASSWVTSFILWIPIVVSGERIGNGCQTAQVEVFVSLLQGVIAVVLAYVIPVIMHISLYAHMIVFLVRQKRLRASSSNHGLGSVSHDLTITVAIGATAHICLYGPEIVFVYLSATSIIDTNMNGWLHHIGTCLVNMNFIANPLVFIRLRSFRRELRGLFSKRPNDQDRPKPNGVTRINTTAV